MKKSLTTKSSLVAQVTELDIWILGKMKSSKIIQIALNLASALENSQQF